jgi:hypothetical protein
VLSPSNKKSHASSRQKTADHAAGDPPGDDRPLNLLAVTSQLRNDPREHDNDGDYSATSRLASSYNIIPPNLSAVKDF